jgi:hypothetical protein
VGYQLLDWSWFNEHNKYLENRPKSACNFILLDYVLDFNNFYNHLPHPDWDERKERNLGQGEYSLLVYYL